MPVPKMPIISNRARKASASSRGGYLGMSEAYTAGASGGDVLGSYNPPSAGADAEVLKSRNKITARARDMVRNNGWAAGAVSKEVDGVIGANFRPILQPDWQTLGLDADWATEFKREVQARWKAYADDPRKMADVTRSQTVSQMFGLSYRTYVTEGEALGVLNWMDRRSTHTALRVVDPDLLCNPHDYPDQRRLRGGVQLNKDGAAVAYHFRQAHLRSGVQAVDGQEYTWKRIPREKRSGRPVVLHFFDKVRDGQTRGVSRLAPIIEKLKQDSHYSKVELQAAILNAVLAAFIRSPMGPDVIEDLIDGEEGTLNSFIKMNDDRNNYYSDRSLKIGGAQITQLYPNDEIGMVSTARPAAQFADFQSAVLRNIASGLGIGYEQLSSDWSKTNYSSARAALVEIWRGWTARRMAFAQGFCQPFFAAWLEEMVLDGHIALPQGAPDFRANQFFYTRAKWVGPGRGFVDPVKEVQASALRVAMGLSTLEDEAAELTGSDVTENFEQITREIEAMPEGVLHPAQEQFAKLLGPNGGHANQDGD